LAVGRLMALDMRVHTNVLKNRKFAHLRLDHRRQALKIVEIIGLERVLVKIPVHHDIEKETAEVISASEEKQKDPGEHDTLHLKRREIGDQPAEDGDGE